jgi:hypothetical protein
MSAAVLGACEAPRFLVGGHHSGSLGGRPNRRGSADPITHRCRELVGGSARLRSARVAPFPSVGTVPLVHALAAFRFLHYQALRNALLREDVPGRKTNAGRVHLPVLFRREVRFVSGGGGCWFAIHSACSASLSHSRTSSSKPALRVGSRVSCPRCSARLACSRYHCALDSMPIEHPRTKAVPGTSRLAVALFRWTLGFPSPSTVKGQGTPPSGPLPWRVPPRIPPNASHAPV